MKLFLSCALAGAALAVASAADKSVDADVQAVFAELRTVKAMEPRQTYTLRARGEMLTGRNDDFLRRRTAEEIAASKLSCGCGDYAALFVERIQARGFEVLLVDAAQISLHSLVNKFDGHVVVAIRRSEATRSPWWLVDPTARNIISRDWSPDAKSFTTSSGAIYWIGFCGPADRYVIRSPNELKRFYADTLAALAPEFFSRTMYRLVFKVDRSLLDRQGNLLNPRVNNLARNQDEIFARHGIKPAREIRILLTRGGDDASGDLRFSDDAGWVSRVGLQSACSPSFLSYMDQVIRRHEERVGR